MSIATKYIGKVGLLAFLLAGVMALGAANAFAATKGTVKTKPAATAKAKTPAKTKKNKKKRHHARKGKAKSMTTTTPPKKS